MYITVTKEQCYLVLPTQPVYYQLVLNLNIIPRNVYQGNQRTMLIYCELVNLCTRNWYQT